MTTQTAAKPLPVLSIIVPTKNEAANIETLLTRIQQALGNLRAEVLFVDDSTDETPRAVHQAATQHPLEITLIARPPERRGNGLSGAVVEGLRVARAPWVCVIDADLQHPPELIPQLLETARRADLDLVVASRDFTPGNTGSLGPARVVVSRALTTAARLLFPARLRDVSDPLTGFFLLRRTAIDIERLRPRGFKILLEILVKFPGLRIAEVLFQFGSRHAGQSKASPREVLNYLSLLSHLHAATNRATFLRFMLVGLSGILVNSLVLAFATEVLDIYYLLSVLLATLGSTSWNFGLTEYWVFRDRQQWRGWGRRYGMFLGVNVLALTLRGPTIYALTDGLGLHYLWSNLMSLGVLSVLRYVLSDRWIWGKARGAWAGADLRPAALRRADQAGTTSRRAKGALMAASYRYDIHGIITIASEVSLPELDQFATTEAVDVPTIRVRIDTSRSAGERTAGEPAVNGHTFRYDEGLGMFGFNAEIRRRETIEVLASPLLRRSPHVLYTNVVEPILRWTFVQKGYALVHGACLAFGDKAYLVTARTDTGKTTTILQILNHQRRASDTAAFLSDDLTLVAADGNVLTYPKPLTVSFHTVKAVNASLLSWRERLALVIQSRIHSRSGRRIALTMTQTRLPMATINALVQWVVPPPKYPVQRLVPRVKFARECRLAGMFVIERGEETESRLAPEQALETLLANSEDSFGFPPYPAMKGFLQRQSGEDLPSLERDIVAQALHNVTATLIRSRDRSWWRRIPQFVGGSLAASFMPRATLARESLRSETSPA